jgi:thiazole synthase
MDSLVIAGRSFRSRLIVGTGKYKSFQETARALEASGAEMVTVAVRRVNLDRSKESLLDYIDVDRYFLLPNTAGCYTADEAIRAARLGREVGLSDWVKLEVIGDQATLYPDVQATLEATKVLVKEGFTVLPYTSDDVVFAKRLLDGGASAIMPLGAPIGSGLGRRRRHRLGCRHRDGTGRRCGAYEYRDCQCSRSRPHGGSDEARRPCRPRSLLSRAHAQEAIRHRQLAPRRRSKITALT